MYQGEFFVREVNSSVFELVVISLNVGRVREAYCLEKEVFVWLEYSICSMYELVQGDSFKVVEL